MDTTVKLFNKLEHETDYLKWNEDYPWGYTAKAEKNYRTKSYVYHYSGCPHMIDKINADHCPGQVEPDWYTKNLKCMTVYDSIVVFDRGDVGVKKPMEIGGQKSEGVLVIKTH